jgi:CheY-like chemotaxis protein
VNFVVCEDDPDLRDIMVTLVESRGHTVVAATDSAYGADQLVSRVQPDVVVTDLALHMGTGLDVLRAADAHGCHAIIYSAYCDQADLAQFTNRPIAVEKPYFDRLEAAIDAVARRHAESADDAGFVERRNTVGTTPVATPPVAPIEQPHEFFSALGNAWPGDGLVAIEAATSAEADDLGIIVRLLVRPQDHIMRRDRHLTALLIGGGPEAPVAVADRVRREWATHAGKGAVQIRGLVIGPDEAPSAAYERLEQLSKTDSPAEPAG